MEAQQINPIKIIYNNYYLELVMYTKYKLKLTLYTNIVYYKNVLKQTT